MNIVFPKVNRTDFNPGSKYGVPKKARVLTVPDLHLRDVDFKTIGNYCKTVNRVFLDVIEFCIENNVTHVIQEGDLYDKGYRHIDRSQNDSNLCRKLADALGGNFFKMIGNHFFIERDNNPAMYLIQPHSVYKPTNPIFQEKPVIQVPDVIMIEGVQFSLNHYSKDSKVYVTPRQPGVAYHIGLFHDDTVVPNSVRQKLGMPVTVSSEYLKMVYEGVDEAIVGHIHLPIGNSTLQIGGRDMSLDISGSLCITKSNELHTSISTPMYDVEDGKVTKYYIDFSLHADKLKFYEKKASPIPSNLVAPDNTGMTPKDIIKSNIGSYLGLTEYLRQEGCGADVMRVIEKASKNELSMKEALAIYLNRDKINASN